MKNILLAGYYGFGNLGDEAILEMFLDLFQKSKNINNVTVLSGNAQETEQRYGVAAIDRYDVVSIIKKIRHSDALVFGGGSLLQDITSKKSIYYYLSLISIAKLFRKKVILLSQGIGPIVYKSNMKKAGRVLKKADVITVRDYKSIEILKSMNVSEDKIKFSADPVINLCAKYPEKKEKSKIKVCFSLRSWKDVHMQKDICDVVERLYNDGIECTFICFHHNIDSVLVDKLQSILGDKAVFIKSRLSTAQAMDIIKDMDLLVGVRLHALILAASAYVPFIALSYDPKIDEFLKCLNLECFTDINSEKTIDSEALYNEIKRKIANKEKEQEKLQKGVEELRKTLDINTQIIDNI